VTTFAAAGKAVDDRIESFRDKFREAIDGFDESLKSADRLGFERGIKMAASLAEERLVGGLTGKKIADSIRKIKYTPGK
jgi:hypothetical protein